MKAPNESRAEHNLRKELKVTTCRHLCLQPGFYLCISTISNSTFCLPRGRRAVPTQACPSPTGWAMPVLCQPRVPPQQLLLSCSAGSPQGAAPQPSIPQNASSHQREPETTTPQRPLLVLFPLLRSNESSSRANASAPPGTALSFQGYEPSTCHSGKPAEFPGLGSSHSSLTPEGKTCRKGGDPTLACLR